MQSSTVSSLDLKLCRLLSKKYFNIFLTKRKTPSHSPLCESIETESVLAEAKEPRDNQVPSIQVAKGQLLADDQEAAALTPTTAEPAPAQAQTTPTSKDVGDTAPAVPALEGATEADDRSLHPLLGIGLVEGQGLGEVRQADIATTLDILQHFFGAGLVIVLEVLVGHLGLTLATHRKMLWTQAVGHEDVLVTVDAAISRIVVVDQRLQELAEDEDLQVIGQSFG